MMRTTKSLNLLPSTGCQRKSCSSEKPITPVPVPVPVTVTNPFALSQSLFPSPVCRCGSLVQQTDESFTDHKREQLEF